MFACLPKERSEIGWVAKDGNHRRVHGGQSLAGLPKRDVVLATAAAIKAYNAKADTYAQVVQKQGQPLREGFSIAMVRAARSLSLLGVASREMQSRDLAPKLEKS